MIQDLQNCIQNKKAVDQYSSTTLKKGQGEISETYGYLNPILNEYTPAKCITILSQFI